ncbi:hypothetical protein AYO45_06165 [Gammaproteobacteria bacterium SCGC AG-212-F23]|nr:hypothetical protein AYO45_06165 [Gammaproteobacteria bacterium SCGC AG-212-F23]
MSLYRKLIDRFNEWLTREPPPSEIPPYDYNRLKYEIRPGDVLLIEGQSRVSEVIRFMTQSSWTHAAMYIGRLHEIEDNHLRKIVATHLKKRENARLVIEGVLGQGIVVTPLANYRHHHIRICRPIGIAPPDIEQVVAHAIRALGKPYNVRQFFDLARFLLPWSILPRRWGSVLFKTTGGEPESGICSSMIAEAFLSVQFPVLPFVKRDLEDNVELVHRNPHLYSPKDFDYSPYFEIIKYPLFDPALITPYYRRLPWAKEGVLHHDHGVITTPETAPTKKKKKFIEKLLWGSDNDNNKPDNEPPSTD